MTCTPFPLCTTPVAPVAFNSASSTLSTSITVQRSLVAQQSTSEIFFFPPSPLVIAALTSSSGPAARVSFPASFFAFTSAFVYSLVSVSSSSRPGVLKLNFLIINLKIK